MNTLPSSPRGPCHLCGVYDSVLDALSLCSTCGYYWCDVCWDTDFHDVVHAESTPWQSEREANYQGSQSDQISQANAEQQANPSVPNEWNVEFSPRNEPSVPHPPPNMPNHKSLSGQPVLSPPSLPLADSNERPESDTQNDADQ